MTPVGHDFPSANVEQPKSNLNFLKLFEIRYSETGDEGYFEQNEVSIVAPDLDYAIKRFRETHRGQVIHWICMKCAEVIT